MNSIQVPLPEDGRRSHDRTAMLEIAGLDILYLWCSGGYQGSYAWVVRDGEGRLGFATDYYGSCSYCDGLIDVSPEEAKTYMQRVVDRIHWRDDLDDFEAWVQSKDFETDAIGYSMRSGQWSPEAMVEAVKAELEGESL